MSNAIQELKAYVTHVCSDKMNIEVPDKIDEKATISEAFDLDSISIYELILNLEEKFSIKVKDEDIAKIGTMTLPELHDYLIDAGEEITV